MQLMATRLCDEILELYFNLSTLITRLNYFLISDKPVIWYIFRRVTWFRDFAE